MYNNANQIQDQAALERKRRLENMGISDNSRDQLAQALVGQKMNAENPMQENQKGTKFNQVLGSAMMGAGMGGGSGWGGLIGGAIGGLAPLAYDYFMKDGKKPAKPSTQITSEPLPPLY